MRKNKNAGLRKPEILESYYQVLIQEGLEGTSISKIAKHLDIHPSLIIHYFKNKENMKLELIELLIEKYTAPQMLDFDHIEDAEERLKALMDMIFSFEWSRTVDPGVHFGFYYLSFRNEDIKKRFKAMFKWLRDYIQDQLVYFKDEGVIDVKDEKKAADFIVTLMEGMEFYAQFLNGEQSFKEFSQISRKTVLTVLKSGDL